MISAFYFAQKVIVLKNKLGVDYMENKYKASIIDMDIKTENRGATARMIFTVNIMSGTADGKIDRTALTKKISDVTDRISKAIECSNKEGFTGTVFMRDGKEYIEKCGKLIPKR